MEFMDVVATRKSVRDYQDKPVEEDKITQILEAARQAPSWANKQGTKYIIVTDKKRIEDLANMFMGFVKKAPAVVVACANPKDSGSRNGMDYYLVDVVISMQQLVLAATNLGLGTCWIGGFDEDKVKKALEIPENVKVVALTPLGYMSGASMKNKFIRNTMVSRKPLEEMVHREKW
ncbi:MAG: nitroreductase family protein [Candidatus Bathyarchaeota archaeon]|nr:nitroreductase family protein [Candidatus Bathyarchaeota archaeon]